MQHANSGAAQGVELYRIGRVCTRTGLSKATIYRLEAKGEFPRHAKLGDRVSVWRSDLVTAWIEARTGDAGRES